MERVWKIKYWLGIGYSKKFKYGSSWVQVHAKLYQRTFAALAKWFIATKVWNICVYYNAKFSMATEFYHVMSFKSINIVFETGKYHSWPNTLPFRVGYWGANTRTPGSDPSTRSSPILSLSSLSLVIRQRKPSATWAFNNHSALNYWSSNSTATHNWSFIHEIEIAWWGYETSGQNCFSNWFQRV